MSKLKDMPVNGLLALYAGTMEELRDRGVVRSSNNPVGDIAEHLFCSAFDWRPAGKSEKGFDACGEDGTRYQIKGRRLHRRNTSRQLSAIRDIDGFDVLAAVLFNDQFRVLRGALIPSEVVRERAKFNRYTNSLRFMLSDNVWNDKGVEDVTEMLRKAEATGDQTPGGLDSPGS